MERGDFAADIAEERVGGVLKAEAPRYSKGLGLS